MFKCHQCGETIEENIDICPNCGTFLYEDDTSDSEIDTDTAYTEDDNLSEPGSYDEALDNLPDETYNDDALEKHELDRERRKFGKSSE